MARGVDHVVHAVRDLDAAAELYRRLGFTVGARNRHPREWGTENHVVQFAGSFIEVLALADPTDIAPHAQRSFSFGAHNRDFLRLGEGLSMIALQGRGAEDAAAFRSAGIGDYQTYDLEREGKRPDGAIVNLGFSLAFACDPGAPEVGFFTAWHRYPENFWHPDLQRHTNTAQAVAGVILVDEDPGRHQRFLSAFAGADDARVAATGLTVPIARGAIQVLTPAHFRAKFGVESPDTSRGARLAGLRLAVREFDAAVKALKAAALDAQVRMGRIVIGPGIAMGATLVLEPAERG
jgi:catechol 2,3-dioxygenase-like lactoylglutathione lyase family enzyme